MTLTLVMAPHAGKIIKNGLRVFERRKFATIWYTILCIYVKPIVRNCVTKLE